MIRAFKAGIFPGTVLFSYKRGKEQIQYMEEKFDRTVSEDSSGAFIPLDRKKNQVIGIVWINKTIAKDRLMSIVSYQASALANHLISSFGISTVSMDNKMISHLQVHFMEEILRLLAECRKRDKKLTYDNWDIEVTDFNTIPKSIGPWKRKFGFNRMENI